MRTAGGDPGSGRNRPDPLRSARTIGIISILFLLLLAVACKKQEVLQPDCAIDDGPCTRMADGMTVTLGVAPKPVRAMRDLAFSVLVKRGSRPVRVADVEIELTMPGMNMGENRVRLQHAGDGRFTGAGVIVRCPSGQMVWKASVIVTEGERSTTADFLFNAP